MSGSRDTPVQIVAALLAFVACGASETPELPPVESAPPPSDDVAAASGRYAVQGVTVQARSGRQREISGTLDLVVEDVRYQVRFDLATTAPDLPGQVPVRVRGDGRGFIVGDVLTGTTEEWLTLEPPPGGLEAVEPSALPLPERAGRKIVSASRASFEEDGTFEVVLENYPGPGEEYEPSMTVLTGRRVPPRATALPPADALPP